MWAQNVDVSYGSWTQAAGVSNKKDMLPGVSSSACDPVCAPLGGRMRSKRMAKEVKKVPIERPVGTAFLRVVLTGDVHHA